MKVAIAANPRKPRALELARAAIGRIGSRAEVVVSDEAPDVGPDRDHRPLEDLGADVVLAIGGDGTFLFTLRRTEAPLLPVNAGTVGILAEVSGERPGELDGAIERLLSGFYHLEERMKLAADLGDQAFPDATNEYVVHAAKVGKMGLFEVALDDVVVGRIRADGLIVSTPTGSTAYSLSSLGPVVDPGLDALVVTAIAPFRVEARAVVIEPLHTLRLRSLEPGRDLVVIADGQTEVPLPSSAPFTVYRSPRRARFVRFGTTFFDRLKGKRILPWTDETSPGSHAGADLPPAA